jgi:hypothetical protein
LFADAQSCPLLKEYAISYLILNAQEVLQSDFSKELREPGDLLSEVIVLLTNKSEVAMGANQLRKLLGNWGLDVDGSKQALVSRFQEAKMRRTDNQSD